MLHEATLAPNNLLAEAFKLCHRSAMPLPLPTPLLAPTQASVSHSKVDLKFKNRVRTHEAHPHGGGASDPVPVQVMGQKSLGYEPGLQGTELLRSFKCYARRDSQVHLGD